VQSCPARPKASFKLFRAFTNTLLQSFSNWSRAVRTCGSGWDLPVYLLLCLSSVLIVPRRFSLN
jgi:hypothetical protein